jgi:hypothetical protein
MFYLFLVLVGFGAVGVYVTLILHLVPGAAEERLGVLEELPPDLGVWQTDDSSPEGKAASARGLIRQIRTCHEPAVGWFGSERLLRQTRYRDRATNEIVRVDQDTAVKRRRVRR